MPSRSTCADTLSHLQGLLLLLLPLLLLRLQVLHQWLLRHQQV